MNLDDLRLRVNDIDSQLLALLRERLDIAEKIGASKKEAGLPLYDPAREIRVMERLRSMNSGLDFSSVEGIWREIIAASRHRQFPLRVAYLGPEGTFTQHAAWKRFGSSAEFVAAQTISAAFAWVLNKTVDYAVLPVENTLQGLVGETVDLLGAAGRPLIVGEIITPISFVFATRASRLEDVARVYSRQEAFGQCSIFLNQPALQQAVRTPVESTADAANGAAKQDDVAALTTETAANLSGLPILFYNVENTRHNKTRFLVLGHELQPQSGHDQTCVFVRVPNTIGGLADMLVAFKDAGINLTKIESRPMDEAVNFETWFFISFSGHINDPRIREMVSSHNLIWLGSYPTERIVE